MVKRRWMPAAAAALMILASSGGAGQFGRRTASLASSEWVYELVMSEGGWDPYQIASASDGGAFVFSDRIDNITRDTEETTPFITRLDSRGRSVWQTAFLMIEEDAETPTGIFPTGDGGCLAGPGHAILARLSGSGSVVWHKRYWDQALSPTNIGYHFRFVPTSDGGAIGTAGGNFVIRVGPDGGVLWGKKYSPSSSSFHFCSAAPEDGLLLASTSRDGFPVFLRLDSEGGILWQRAYRLPATATVYSVFPREDGGFLVQGSISPSSKMWILRLDSAGQVLWGRTSEIDYFGEIVHRQAFGAGGDAVLSVSQGLLQLDAMGQVVSSFPVAMRNHIRAASSAADGGFYLAGRDGIAKTDASGSVSGCSLRSETTSGLSLITWTAESVSFTSETISVGFEDLPFTPQPLAGTWSAVCRDPNSFYLTMVAAEGGTTNPPPGLTSLERGAAITVEAIAEEHYEFAEWTGDVPEAFRLSAAFPLTMDEDKTLQPHFLKIQAPLNLAGRRVAAQLRSTAFDILTWTPHPENRNVEKYRIFSVPDGVEMLLAEVPAAMLTYVNRKAARTSPEEYAVCAVTESGREGARATVTVQ
ncbi:MAG: hypothetical protein PHI34_00780 [Acidobacteriota bacterium]|nr:hypothetical protein [Acidobacteriota bacterium]